MHRTLSTLSSCPEPSRRAQLSTLLILAFLLALVPLSAHAAIIQAGEDLSIVIPLNDDLYAAGGTIMINPSIKGDVVLAGGKINVKGIIEQDLILAGGNVMIQGIVQDDVRAAAGTAHVEASVGDDLILFGGDIVIDQGTVVKGDLRIMAGSAYIYGKVEGDLYVRSGVVKFYGDVAGNADIQSDELDFHGAVDGDAKLSSLDLHIANDSSIGGNLRYWQPSGEYAFTAATVGGDALFDEKLALEIFDNIEDTAVDAVKLIVLGWAAYGILSAALFILMLMLMTRKFFPDCAKTLSKKPDVSFAYGLLYFVATPMIAVIFLLSLIGIPIGLAIIASYLFAVLFSKSITALVLAHWCAYQKTKGSKKTWGGLWIFLLAVVLYVLLTLLILIPIVGYIALGAIVMLACGSVVHTKLERFKKVR